MVVDYDALSTPDLLLRDSKLGNRTRVMGMSKTSAKIHKWSLVFTSGVSLPINLMFFIWYGYRYGKVKKERTRIRQILGTRNMAYQGKGRWLQLQPTPDIAQKVHITPTPHADIDVQFAKAAPNAAVNNLQQDFGNNDSCIEAIVLDD